ncbi:MAG: rod shape-determining protein [Oscillospiraceae bacterium]|jgi:rod shape-determining protein MreB|nr:rod shape-determining protein [Oscillospiraceae bacterium]
MSSLAIDLGTSHTRIFIPNKGVVVNEPSVVAVDPLMKNIYAIGSEAFEMLGRTSKDIQVVYPLLGGMIRDYCMIEGMVKFFLKRAKKAWLIMPKALICIPGEITDVQKIAVINAIQSAGIRKVRIIEAPIAAAVGSGIEISNPRGLLVVNVGAGTTDIAIMSLNGLVASTSLRIAGDDMDEAITRYVKCKHNLIIGKRTAEILKIKIGSVFPQVKRLVHTVKGKDTINRLPKSVEVFSDEVFGVLSKVVEKILDSIVEMLEIVSPELVADILSDGVTLSGGCARLAGLDKAISSRTGLEVKVVEEPEFCVARGAGESIKYMSSNVHMENFGVINPLSLD